MQLSLRKKNSNIFNENPLQTNVTSIQDRIQFKLLLRKDKLNNKLHSLRLNPNTSSLNNNVIDNPSSYNFITNPQEYFNSLTTENLLLSGLNYIFNYITNSTDNNNSISFTNSSFQQIFISCINSLIKTYLHNENVIILIIKILISLCEYNLHSNNEDCINNNNELFEFAPEIFFYKNEYVMNYINVYSVYYKINETISLLMLYLLGYCIHDENVYEEMLFKCGFIQNVIKELNIETDNIDVLHSKIWFLSLLNTKNTIQLDNSLCIVLQKKLIDIILIDKNNNDVFDTKNERFGPFIHNAITSLANLSDYSGEEFISNFISYEIIPYLISNKTTNQFLLEPIIKIIGNILSNSYERIQIVINEDLLNFLIFTLTYNGYSSDIKNLSLWAMSNIIIDNRNINELFFEKIMKLYIALLEEGNEKNNFDIDCEITINLGALIGNTEDDNKRIEMIKEYNICTVLKNFISKYANKIESNKQAKACYFAMSIVYELIMFKHGTSGLMSNKIFHENGTMDLIERIVHLATIKQRNINDMKLNTDYFEYIVQLGEKLLENSSNDNNINSI